MVAIKYLLNRIFASPYYLFITPLLIDITYSIAWHALAVSSVYYLSLRYEMPRRVEMFIRKQNTCHDKEKFIYLNYKYVFDKCTNMYLKLYIFFFNLMS